VTDSLSDAVALLSALRRLDGTLDTSSSPVDWRDPSKAVSYLESIVDAALRTVRGCRQCLQAAIDCIITRVSAGKVDAAAMLTTTKVLVYRVQRLILWTIESVSPAFVKSSVAPHHPQFVKQLHDQFLSEARGLSFLGAFIFSLAVLSC
jgi:hypothetical protein